MARVMGPTPPGTRDGHPAAAEQFDDAARRARQRTRLAENQLAEVGRVQPIRVLGRIHPVEHGVGIEPVWQRQLRQAGPYFRGDGLAVKQLCGHASSSELVELSGRSDGRR